MNERPSNVVAASALAIIGGIVAIAAMAWNFDANSSNVLWSVGLMLLIAVMFFASAGFLYQNGKGNWYGLLFICFLNVAVLICDLINGTVNKPFGAALLVIAIAVALLSSLGSTSKWIEMDRI
jgi:hypothetical protein